MSFELLQDMVSEFLIGAEPLLIALADFAGGLFAGVGTHEQLVDGIILGQHDRSHVRPIFKQMTIVIDQSIECGGIILSDPAPHDQILRARHSADRIERLVAGA